MTTKTSGSKTTIATLALDRLVLADADADELAIVGTSARPITTTSIMPISSEIESLPIFPFSPNI